MNRDPAADAPSTLPSRLTEWRGTARYEVRRCIGGGGMGTVYEAFDCERGLSVALKRLRHFSPAGLYLFKQEFRALADVVHRNLVRLHELVAVDPQDVFFTMELVSGDELPAYVRAGGAPSYGRLRDALRQLAEGLRELHAAGKLHRDIKPSNVLVGSDGRLVILDFGVATDWSPASNRDSQEEPIVGTAAYMAPEQALGAAPTPASDWYGVGALLFEALTGNPPFVGSSVNVLDSKQNGDPPAPSRVVPNVPGDLDALCMALLRRAPAERPSGDEILARLGVAGDGGAETVDRSPPETGRLKRLVGRERHLHELGDAFRSTCAGRSITVRIRGPSGMGKTSLAQDFLDGLASRDEAIVLSGRAYERESVPYKAIDSWIDALSRYLLRRSDLGKPPALPRDIWALARLFPVLRRVPEVADTREDVLGDPQRLRRRAFAALRELLATLSETRPVVIHVDDAHWGDADSAAVLHEIVRPPRAPTILLLMTYREEEERTSPFFGETRTHWPRGAEERELEVGPLDLEDAARLAVALLGADDAATRDLGAAFAKESGGNPFLIEELVRGHKADPSNRGGGAKITLDRSVWDRLERLPGEARKLIEMLAVSGRPLRVSVARASLGLPDGFEDVVARLRTDRLIRDGLRSGQEVIEVMHDRIAEAIVLGLPEDRVRAHHAQLARVLESTPGSDPEMVAVHLLGAGDKEHAAQHAELAAEAAVGKLAFARAAQLFRLALEGGRTKEGARRLKLRLAETLAWAGRGAEAAHLYLEAAAEVRGAERLELERAAAQQLLASGRVDEGARVLHAVLAAVGVSAPRSTLAILLSLFFYRVWLTIVGLRFKDREPGDVRESDRIRIDAMQSASLGFAVVNALLGAYMQARLLILCLRAGDRLQLLRALALEAGQRASVGGPESDRERASVALSRRLVAKLGDSQAEGVLENALGIGLFLRGRWKQASAALAASAAKLVHGDSPSHDNGQLFAIHALFFSGQIGELVRRHARFRADAEDRGDLYASVNLATTTTITAHLVTDDPEGGRWQVREAMAQWSQSGFFVQHWQAMAFEPEIDLYLGRGAAAYDRIGRGLPALRKSLLLNVQFVRGITWFARGRCAVASISDRPTLKSARLDEARKMVRRLEREGMQWMLPLAALVEAAAENAAGRHAEAIAALRKAISTSEAAEMTMHAVVAKFRMGELLGGDEGRALVESSRAAVADEGIKNPARWVSVYLPGIWSAPS
jgi:serine/threonine protein kinase